MVLHMDLNPHINSVSSDIVQTANVYIAVIQSNLAFKIGGEAAPHLLPLTYYLLLPKNPITDFILR